MIIFFFFFSSRRRHTRFSRDWSSDVCSSDLWCPSLPVLRVHGLAGDPEGVPDLFPRPAVLPGELHVGRLDLLGQPPQRTDRPEADRRIVRSNRRRDPARSHGCQFRLTHCCLSICPDTEREPLRAPGPSSSGPKRMNPTTGRPARPPAARAGRASRSCIRAPLLTQRRGSPACEEAGGQEAGVGGYTQPRPEMSPIASASSSRASRITRSTVLLLRSTAHVITVDSASGAATTATYSGARALMAAPSCQTRKRNLACVIVCRDPRDRRNR